MSEIEPNRTPIDGPYRWPVVGGRLTRENLPRPLPPPAFVPDDATGRRIVDLFALNPGLAARFSNPDVRNMSAGDRRTLLDRLNADLGIKPTRTRSPDLVRY